MVAKDVPLQKWFPTERRQMILARLAMVCFVKSTKKMNYKSVAHAVLGIAAYNGRTALLKPPEHLVTKLGKS